MVFCCLMLFIWSIWKLLFFLVQHTEMTCLVCFISEIEYAFFSLFRRMLWTSGTTWSFEGETESTCQSAMLKCRSTWEIVRKREKCEARRAAECFSSPLECSYKFPRQAASFLNIALWQVLYFLNNNGNTKAIMQTLSSQIKVKRSKFIQGKKWRKMADVRLMCVACWVTL